VWSLVRIEMSIKIKESVTEWYKWKWGWETEAYKPWNESIGEYETKL